MSSWQTVSFLFSMVCLVAAVYNQLISKKYENVPYWMGLAILNLLVART